MHFLDPETAKILQFLDPEIVNMDQKFLDPEIVEMVWFLDPETTEILQFMDPEIVKMDQNISGSRYCRNGAKMDKLISGSINLRNCEISGSRNRRNGRQILYGYHYRRYLKFLAKSIKIQNTGWLMVNS